MKTSDRPGRLILFSLALLLAMGTFSLPPSPAGAVPASESPPFDEPAPPGVADLPPGATRLPKSAWTREPPQGREVRYDAWGQVTGVWSCIQWEQLLPGADITCGYEEIFTICDPSMPPFAEAMWVCVEAPNALVYTVPFNKGRCFYAHPDNLPQGAFVPDEGQCACGAAERDEIVTNNAALPAGSRINFGYNRFRQQQRAQFYRLQLVAGSVAAGLLLRAGSIPLEGVRKSLVTDGLTGSIQSVGGAFAPAGNWPTCADTTSAPRLLWAAAGPADDDYQIITPPQPLPPKSFAATGGLTQEEADAVNALLANQAQAAGYLRALGTALRKADLAAAAGAPDWERAQLQAAGQFSWQAAPLMEAQIDLYAALAAAYTAAGHTYDIPLEEAVVWAWQSSLSTSTTQDKLRLALADLGATAHEQDLFLLGAYLADSQAVVSYGDGQIPAVFIDPNFVEALQQVAATLREGPIGASASRTVYLPLVAK